MTKPILAANLKIKHGVIAVGTSRLTLFTLSFLVKILVWVS